MVQSMYSGSFRRITDCINAADTCKNKWKDDRCRTLYTAHQLCLPGHFYSTGLLRIFNFVEISYNIGYAVAIALRYIPDVQDDFHKIKNAQEARGIEMSGKAKLMSRIKSTASIIFPLIFTSIGRIDTISNAMELRGYGKHRKRTWYMGRKLQRNDYLCIALVLGFAVAALVITYHDGSRFYNPFI